MGLSAFAFTGMLLDGLGSVRPLGRFVIFLWVFLRSYVHWIMDGVLVLQLVYA